MSSAFSMPAADWRIFTTRKLRGFRSSGQHSGFRLFRTRTLLLHSTYRAALPIHGQLLVDDRPSRHQVRRGLQLSFPQCHLHGELRRRLLTSVPNQLPTCGFALLPVSRPPRPVSGAGVRRRHSRRLHPRPGQSERFFQQHANRRFLAGLMADAVRTLL